MAEKCYFRQIVQYEKSVDMPLQMKSIFKQKLLETKKHVFQKIQKGKGGLPINLNQFVGCRCPAERLQCLPEKLLQLAQKRDIFNSARKS